MRTQGALAFIAVFSTGLTAGILFGDRMGATYARAELPASSFVKFQQMQHVHFARMMPILLVITILSSLAWLFVIRSRAKSASFPFLALGTLAFISIVVMTRMVNVPINNLLMTWSASSPPPEMAQIWARWEHVHTIRTAIAVLGFACELSAFAASKGHPAA